MKEIEERNHIDQLRRKYYLRLLRQRESLIKVVREVDQNIRQINMEIAFIKDNYGYVTEEKRDEKSYFHLKELEEEEGSLREDVYP